MQHCVASRWAVSLRVGPCHSVVRACMPPPIATQKSCRDTKPYHALYTPCCARCCAVSRALPLVPCVGQAVSRPGACLCHACCVTILLYRDQIWKMGSSLSSFLSGTFFFLCSTHCKTIEFFFFSYLPVEP